MMARPQGLGDEDAYDYDISFIFLYEPCSNSVMMLSEENFKSTRTLETE
jgi:hypothetical protein